jgi:microcompartment protein CcmL/EutN
LKKQRAIRATSETWTSLGELPASHVVPLPARSVATVVLQGRLR